MAKSGGLRYTGAVGRRGFLRGGLAAIGGAAVGGSALPAHAAPQSSREVDVLICGGGCAGLAAALAAARQGANTLLVERAGFAGGIITAVGLPYFDGIADIKTNRIVVRGVALELLSKSDVCAPDATEVRVHNPTVPNVEAFKKLADELIVAERPRLDVLYHTTVCGVERDNDRVTAVLLANKAGLTRVVPKVVIDCTGDADVAAWAGVQTDKAAELQPMTLHFRIGNVKRSPEISKRCREAVEKAHARGELPMFYGPGLVFLFAPDEVYVHGIRVPGDATDPVDLTRAEIQGRRDAWAMFDAWRRDVPGFEDSYFMTSGPFIGVRETRRLVGQHVLTEQDVMSTRRFDDAIATGSWYLDLHPNKVTVGSANAVPKAQPAPYDIPWRSLLPRDVTNLVVAGRCHSATQLAASSTRVTCTAMALGEAAATGAVLSLRAAGAVGRVDGADVRKALKQHGAGPIQDLT